jgi:hypothetical protein
MPGARRGGQKTNFGFNVKYNKSGTNLRGQVNIIVRNGGRTYQIKSNSITSLAANSSTGTATFNGKATIRNRCSTDQQLADAEMVFMPRTT